MKYLVNTLTCLVLFICLIQSAHTSEELNVYSARKEAYIKPLLDQFAATHDVSVNLVTSKADALIQRLKSEAENTPADILITVDAGRLHRAKQADLLQAVDTARFAQLAPTQYMDPDGYWFGLSLRARTMVYQPQRVAVDTLSSYEALADSQWTGRICIRSSNNIYNQSLVASMIAHHGMDTTQQWANGLVKNFARKPQGGDQDQIKAVVAGQCDVALINTYYLAKMLAGSNDEKNIARQVQVFWANQDDRGTHVNVSGIALTKYAHNTELAIKLIEFLYTDQAQSWYGEVNMEYPVRADISIHPTLMSWGKFKADELALEQLGVLNSQAVKIMDIAGWK